MFVPLMFWILVIIASKWAVDPRAAAARAVLEAPQSPSGSNGFLLMQYAASPLAFGELEADFARYLQRTRTERFDTLEESYALFGPDPGIELPFEACSDATRCPADLAELHRTQGVAIDRAEPVFARIGEALQRDHAHFPREHPMPADVLFPPYHLLVAMPLVVANGQPGELAAVCEVLLGVRQWSREPDHVLQAMILERTQRRGEVVLDIVLGRAPARQLPTACQELRQPAPRASTGFCGAMRGEFRFTKAQTAVPQTRLQLARYPAAPLEIPALLGRVFSDGRHHADAMAFELSRACLPDAASAMDSAQTPALTYPTVEWTDWLLRPLDALNRTRDMQAFPSTLDAYAARWIDHVASMARVAHTLDAFEAVSQEN
jgi:hypothetical protein